MRFHSSSICTLIGAALLAIAQTSSASGGVVVESTGTNCIQSNVQGGSANSYVLHGFMGNDSTSTGITVRCPADIVDSSGIIYPDGRAVVEVQNGTNDTALTCQLRLYSGSSANTSNYDFTSDSTSIGGGTDSLIMNMDQDATGFPLSRYYITCELPAKTSGGSRSYVLSYSFSSATLP